jgi:hypothetical protein
MKLTIEPMSHLSSWTRIPIGDSSIVLKSLDHRMSVSTPVHLYEQQTDSILVPSVSLTINPVRNLLPVNV